ncbi:MAG: hypothetical protein K940chlam2_00545, partial [Chlamydiae bacterium]|nr:hypothetical protein [Chlamydiota bacterium]
MPPPIGPYLSTPFSNSASPAAFTNHQNWQISLSRDPHTGAPTFQVTDQHGLSHTLTEFIVEEVDTSDVEQQGIFDYLEKRLNAATCFQIHVERANTSTPFIRFGAYGVQGGFPKWAAYATSTIQLGAGVALCATGIGGIAGGVLISSGLSGGFSTLNEEDDEMTGWNYLKQTGYGVVSGAVSGGIGTLGSGGTAAAKFGYQVLSGVAGNASSQTVSTVVDKGRLPTAGELGKQVVISGVSGGLGAGAGKLAGGVVGKQAGTAAKVAKAALKGAASSGTS